MVNASLKIEDPEILKSQSRFRTQKIKMGNELVFLEDLREPAKHFEKKRSRQTIQGIYIAGHVLLKSTLFKNYRFSGIPRYSHSSPFFNLMSHMILQLNVLHESK